MDSTNIALGATGVVLIISGLAYLFMGGGTSKGNDHSKDRLPKKGKNDDEKSGSGKYPAGPMSIYFGSQTGTAEGFARVLMDEGKARGFQAKMVDLFDFEQSKESFIEQLRASQVSVFLVATYGEGEPTDNAEKFAKWLKGSDPSLPAEEGALAGLNFTVFGLGNKQYEHFNRQGKNTNSGLEALGGTRVFDYGEGDDDANLELDFDKWKALLWPALVSRFHPDGGASSSTSLSMRRNRSLDFKTIFLSSGAAKGDEVPLSQVNTSTRYFFTAPSATVLVNRELRSPNSGSTRHIEISLKDIPGGLLYETADNLAVLPENNPLLVEQVCKRLDYNPEQVFTLAKTGDSDYKLSFPTPCTIRQALTQFVDLQGHVRAATAAALLPYVKDESQTSWLSTILSPENRAEFTKLLEIPRRSVVSLLCKELSSAVVPLQDLLHILPLMQPRYYTISSSSSRFPDVVHITVSVTEARTESGELFRGLTSSYLQSLVPNKSTCRIFIRPSSFRLPKTLSTPILMVGPGTGVAPMRALLQEREERSRKSSSPTGSNTLYFGCQSKSKDYIYREELEAFQASKTLSRLELAFSRETSQKVYVQHLLQREADATALAKSIDEGAYVYVCGGTTMGADVMEAFLSVLQSKKQMTRAQSESFVKEMQAKGRYVQELWSA